MPTTDCGCRAGAQTTLLRLDRCLVERMRSVAGVGERQKQMPGRVVAE